MKKLTNLFYFVIIVGLVLSCEEKDPFTIHEESNNVAPFVRIDVATPVIDVTNLEGSAYEFTLTSSENVSTYELITTAIIGEDTLTGSVRTISSFPSTERVTASDLATALDTTISALSPGTRFDFTSMVTRTDGFVISSADIHPNVSGSQTLSSGHAHVTFISCPFVSEGIVGTHTVNQLDFSGFFEETMSTREVIAGPRENQIIIVGGTFPTNGDSNDLIVNVNPITGQASYGGGSDDLELGENATGGAAQFASSRYGGVTGFVFSCTGTIDIVVSFGNGGGLGPNPHTFNLTRNN